MKFKLSLEKLCNIYVKNMDIPLYHVFVTEYNRYLFFKKNKAMHSLLGVLNEDLDSVRGKFSSNPEIKDTFSKLNKYQRFFKVNNKKCELFFIDGEITENIKKFAESTYKKKTLTYETNKIENIHVDLTNETIIKKPHKKLEKIIKEEQTIIEEPQECKDDSSRTAAFDYLTWFFNDCLSKKIKNQLGERNAEFEIISTSGHRDPRKLRTCIETIGLEVKVKYKNGAKRGPGKLTLITRHSYDEIIKYLEDGRKKLF